MALLGRLALIVGLLALLGFLACRWLWPERLAVNAPITNSLFGWGVEPPSEAAFGSRIRVPEGFSIALYAELPRVRFLRATPAGDLLASVPREGRVVLLERDGDGDGAPDGRRTLLEGLDRPHGLELFEGWLYVAESGAVGRVRFDPETGETRGEFERVVGDLPEGGNHWTRTIGFGPDDRLYVTVGSSCNVCFEEDERRAAMLRYRPDGSEGEIFAKGLRNAVGFAWQPETGALYATENGRDLLGDDFPPCELNRVVEGGDYGWPVANGDRVPDPDLGAGQEARTQRSIPPVFDFDAHNAPLGIAFLTHPDLPEDYRGAALVALHGSWNRTRKDGYEVVSLHWGRDGRITSRPFVQGFLRDEEVIGRPVDVAEGPDGTIYVSDDYAGAVYRVVHGDSRARRGAPAPRSEGGAAEPTATGEGQATGGSDASQTALPPDARREAAARGAALFEARDCASCHIPARAEAGVVPVPLADLASHYDVDSLAAYLAAPTPPMPAVDLPEDARRALALHLLDRFGEPRPSAER